MNIRDGSITVSNLEAALEYAELGFRVFPCQPDGKAPATEHGCLDATTDEKQIEAWWTKDPSLNVAIATEGLLVLDVDPEGKPLAGNHRAARPAATVRSHARRGKVPIIGSGKMESS
jgi:hypothetical protein